MIPLALRVLAWSRDGSRLAVAGDQDGTVRLWSPATGAVTDLSGHRRRVTVLAWSHTDHRDRVHSVAWSADGHHLATCDDTGLVIMWDRAGNEITSLVLQPSQCLACRAFLAVGQPGEPALLTLRDHADPSG
jgi:WD40 repeat protein